MCGRQAKGNNNGLPLKEESTEDNMCARHAGKRKAGKRSHTTDHWSGRRGKAGQVRRKAGGEERKHKGRKVKKQVYKRRAGRKCRKA